MKVSEATATKINELIKTMMFGVRLALKMQGFDVTSDNVRDCCDLLAKSHDNIGDLSCNHDWFLADLAVVDANEICIKCHAIRK